MIIMLLVVAAGDAFGQAPAEQPPARVVLDQVQEKWVAENTPVVGTIYYDRASSLAPEVAGIVDSARVRAGDRVRRGDVLLTLNTDFIDKEIALVRTRIAQVENQMEKADKDLRRYEALYREDATSEKLYTDILYARRGLGIQRDALALELATAELKKSKSTLRAPYDGQLLEKTVDVGSYVGPGTVCFRMGALESLYVKVPVTESLVKYARPGDPVDVTINALDLEITGTLDGFLPVADVMTRNIMLKVKIPASDQMAENMSATVRVAVSSPRMLKLVPRDALVSLQGQDSVYTVREGKSVPLPVRILAYIGTRVAVESEPLTAGMEVIVDGAQRLQPDQPVQVTAP
ncbi:MAG: efflux RND transporter periplasmic adaptor subunit [Thermodesulfobacteriota bacterium]